MEASPINANVKDNTDRNCHVWMKIVPDVLSCKFTGHVSASSYGEKIDTDTTKVFVYNVHVTRSQGAKAINANSTAGEKVSNCLDSLNRTGFALLNKMPEDVLNTTSELFLADVTLIMNIHFVGVFELCQSDIAWLQCFHQAVVCLEDTLYRDEYPDYLPVPVPVHEASSHQFENQVVPESSIPQEKYADVHLCTTAVTDSCNCVDARVVEAAVPRFIPTSEWVTSSNGAWYTMVPIQPAVASTSSSGGNSTPGPTDGTSLPFDLRHVRECAIEAQILVHNLRIRSKKPAEAHEICPAQVGQQSVMDLPEQQRRGMVVLTHHDWVGYIAAENDINHRTLTDYMTPHRQRQRQRQEQRQHGGINSGSGGSGGSDGRYYVKSGKRNNPASTASLANGNGNGNGNDTVSMYTDGVATASASTATATDPAVVGIQGQQDVLLPLPVVSPLSSPIAPVAMSSTGTTTSSSTTNCTTPPPPFPISRSATTSVTSNSNSNSSSFINNNGSSDDSSSIINDSIRDGSQIFVDTKNFDPTANSKSSGGISRSENDHDTKATVQQDPEPAAEGTNEEQETKQVEEEEEEESVSFAEHFISKGTPYSRIARQATPGQPLLPVIRLSTKTIHVPLLSPVEAIIIEKDRDAWLNKNSVYRQKNDSQYFLPQLSRPMGPMRFYLLHRLLPSVMHRVSSLLIAEEARSRVRHLINHVATAPVVAAAQAEPSIMLVLEAITPKLALEGYDSERLEILGDSVLKLVVSVDMYRRFPSVGEGVLTQKRMEFISNRKLYQEAGRRGIEGFLRAAPLSMGEKSLDICPPGLCLDPMEREAFTMWCSDFLSSRILTIDSTSQSPPKIKSRFNGKFQELLKFVYPRAEHKRESVVFKRVADLMEALIGAYYINGRMSSSSSSSGVGVGGGANDGGGDVGADRPGCGCGYGDGKGGIAAATPVVHALVLRPFTDVNVTPRQGQPRPQDKKELGTQQQADDEDDGSGTAEEVCNSLNQPPLSSHVESSTIDGLDPYHSNSASPTSTVPSNLSTAITSMAPAAAFLPSYRLPEYGKLMEQLQYQFNDISLLQMALRHSSSADVCNNNQRLEFLGDAVLDLVLLEHHFLASNRTLDVSELHQEKENQVNNDRLAKAAAHLFLQDYMEITCLITRKNVDSYCQAIGIPIPGIPSPSDAVSSFSPDVPAESVIEPHLAVSLPSPLPSQPAADVPKVVNKSGSVDGEVDVVVLDLSRLIDTADSDATATNDERNGPASNDTNDHSKDAAADDDDDDDKLNNAKVDHEATTVLPIPSAPKALADALEAIVGAVYLDCGEDIEVVATLLRTHGLIAQ